MIEPRKKWHRTNEIGGVAQPQRQQEHEHQITPAKSKFQRPSGSLQFFQTFPTQLLRHGRCAKGQEGRGFAEAMPWGGKAEISCMGQGILDSTW
jgi:hypothetical protein